MEKPKNVSLGVNLQWISLALGVIVAIFDPAGMTHNSPIPGGLISIMAATVVILGLLNYMVLRGKNWARITFLVMYLFGLIPAILSIPHSFSTSVVFGMTGIIQSLLQAAALFLFFSASAKPWFKKEG
jgi:hypothetical protein